MNLMLVAATATAFAEGDPSKPAWIPREKGLYRSQVLGNFPKSNSPESVAKTEAFVKQRLDEMEAFGFRGIDQVQIHVRTDLREADPFCPSTPFLKAAVERLHKYGVSVNTVTWTLGDREDLYLRLWDLGFDHFTTDYPETMFSVIEKLK